MRSHRILDILLKVELTGFADGLDVEIRESRMMTRIVAVAARAMELPSFEEERTLGGAGARGRSRV